ncbi:VOC family protein [Pseudoalteromonas sp. SR44-5]|jgi:catechol 2,3-dioxygenase|uniref:VOC family protein n=2 Tax=Pseudoalteromonas TaxID=53246 RepID=A0ABY3F946_9GAMM|nr:MULTISPECIES: VOC family protein [Pseudoalteromonas]MBB1295233.1 VOC family protein [Pseudoalteromonas sp. SR41-4]MBB1303510.1 VOC family protein [Pseudoalteromonas sp. SR44-8]MBB1308954.1 VOC family protein [Pseudoalteromonas sp. SR41-8]MBB1333800.1 VOC family protein [Pseudoalteromonas sp. SR41-6]MBB1342724.1 VOC family protein [Pseudoalteromonas sp. SR45-6]|tara:strand:+ start:11499 stop:11888 length:390 start_codon:yes stop_codon:yes gene_type:complete
MAMPTLSGVDHCHLNVTNLAQAVTWYKTVLGFNIVPELAFWDEGTGPLTLEDPAATIRLALFEREGSSKGIAFGASGEQFIAWLKHLADLNIKTVVADHKVTYSVYFQDLSGNSHEITSHDYAYISANI